MRKITKFLSHPLSIVLLVLLFDQWLKIWVKLNMYIREDIEIFGDWFIIHFTENNGMAFGLEFGGEWGKLALSIFRIVAVSGIGYFLYKLYRENAPRGVVISFALIFAGAVGNILDSMFYGLLFSESFRGELAQFLPESGGYAGFLHGKVVDMLYFELIDDYYPSWFPIWANQQFIFFRPVFNIADSSITIGVLIILLFHRNFFASEKKQKKNPVEP